MNDKKQTVAVIVPAHNEELHIASCLDSLLGQTVPVDEIIVISNNSTDRTAEIVKKYPTVKLIETDIKGLINARNMGFNISRSDILARINADVTCDAEWNKNLRKAFSDETVMAVAGTAKTKTLPTWPYAYSFIWASMYLLYAEAYFGVHMLWGANMAIRKSAWEKIITEACQRDQEVHEDQDLSIHLAGQGLKSIYDKKLKVTTKEQSYFEWQKIKHYNFLHKNTKALHYDILHKNSTRRFNLIQRFWRGLVAAVPGALFTGWSFIFWATGRLWHRWSGKDR